MMGMKPICGTGLNVYGWVRTERHRWGLVRMPGTGDTDRTDSGGVGSGICAMLGDMWPGGSLKDDSADRLGDAELDGGGVGRGMLARCFNVQTTFGVLNMGYKQHTARGTRAGAGSGYGMICGM